MVGVYKKREKIKYKNQLFQIIERKDKKDIIYALHLRRNYEKINN